MKSATQVEFHRIRDEIGKNTWPVDTVRRHFDYELAIREDILRDQESRGTVIGEQERLSEDLAEHEPATPHSDYLDGPSGCTAGQPSAHRPTLPASSTWSWTFDAEP